MTRTSRVGYLRDVRRLTVALSRARLGLYILGRREIFEACYELRPAFDLLLQRPDKLALVTGEMFPTQRPYAPLEDAASGSDVATAVIPATAAAEAVMEGVEHLGQYVFEMTNAKVKALREERGLATIAEGAADGGSLPPVVGTAGADGEQDVPIRTIGDEEDGAEDDEPDAANDDDNDDDDEEEDEEQDPEPDVKETA